MSFLTKYIFGDSFSEKLVVLDINKLLVYKVSKKEEAEIKNKNLDLSNLSSFSIADGNYKIYIRPYFKALIDYLKTSKYKVAIWGSDHAIYTQELVRKLFEDEPEFYKRLVFIWDRSQCEVDKRVNRPNKWAVFKNLNKIWYSKKFEGKWTEDNTIIISSSEDKTYMQPENRIIVKEWSLDMYNPDEINKKNTDFWGSEIPKECELHYLVEKLIQVSYKYNFKSSLQQ